MTGQLGSRPRPAPWLILLVLVLVGCEQEPPRSTPSPAPAKAKSSPPPSGPILFQPMLIWEGGNPTHQGTGFLTTTPGGQVVGITSAHFINFDGPPLLEVRWLRIGTAQAVARFDRSLGPPGSAGLTEPKLDLRPDYLLLVGHVSASEVKTLELDERPNPEIGEKVWLPNKDPAAESGYRLIQGTVAAAAATHSAVHFPQAFKLQSQSGSPVISQRTGKVIGTLSRGTETPKGLVLFLAPARSILDAMEAKDRPKLRDVIGPKR